MQHDYDYYTASEIFNLTGLGYRAVYRLIRQNSFPAPMIIAGRHMWKKSVVDHWMDCKLDW